MPDSQATDMEQVIARLTLDDAQGCCHAPDFCTYHRGFIAGASCVVAWQLLQLLGRLDEG